MIPFHADRQLDYDKQERSNLLYKCNSDNLFPGTGNFLKNDFPADHNPRKILKKLYKDVIPQSFCNIQCHYTGKI